MNKTFGSLCLGSQRLFTVAIAGLLSFTAGQAQAVEYPDIPLQSGAAYPAPNVWFILDDSGSMTSAAMPADKSTSELDDTIQDKSYVHNTLYYNPANTYQTWLQADGSRMSGGTSFTSACSSNNEAGSACSHIDLSENTQTFFVPKSTMTDKNDASQYDRYDIKTSASTTKIYSIQLSALESWDDQDIAGRGLWKETFEVPANTAQLVVTTRNGGNNGDADLYLNFNSEPDYSNRDECQQTSDGHEHTCTIDNPDEGTWYITVYNDSRRNQVRNLDIAVNLATATESRPTTRTVAEELSNYATWYSYHRTRMKVAKAGASEAFGQVGDKLRIGFDSINRNIDDLPYKIPVNTSNGAFTGSNKTEWYSKLHASEGSGFTPLRIALNNAGTYFKDDDASGPWGPEATDDQISCRQNFAILTTDGYWNDDRAPTRRDPNPARPPALGNSDNLQGPLLTSTSGSTYQYDPTAAANKRFPDSYSDTLADFAMEFWKKDLRSDLVNNVPTSSANPAFWQNMTTFGVSIGLQGTLNPSTDIQQIELGTKAWPDVPSNTGAERIDDLLHASVNGHGSFVVASNTKEFAQGLLDAFAVVAQRQGSASNVTANSTSFNTDTRVFQASYVSGKWTGELAAYGATSSGASSTPTWRASQGIPSSGRKVFTWDPSATVKGATFPTTAQTTALDQSSRSSAPVSGSNNAAYLKGSRSLERINGGALRTRDHVLGDIVNSSPMYVQDTNTIYVGANDGMLHAFSAASGQELFAYVPAGIDLSKLAQLSDPYYVHSYFVDGPVVVSNRNQTPGKNYLVAALGRGGKGLFGLDVSNPTTFANTDIKWQLNSGANLGQILGEPIITTLGDGTKVVIFGNGINSTDGKAVLYVVNLTNGNILQEIDTGVGSDNGLSAPRGWDDDGDGDIDYVYAGDLKGNLWKFNFNATGTGSLANGTTPMFTAGTGQAISAGLALARDPLTNRRWVFFGTGKFISSTDPANVTVQSVYGLIDDGTAVAKANLQERKIVVSKTVAGKALRGFEANATLASGKKGWYLDLGTPTPGERVIDRPLVRGSVLIFSSIIPPTTGTCEAGGRGYVNALDAFTGSSTGKPYFDSDGDGDVDNNDSLTPATGDKVPTGSIDLGVGMVTLPNIIDNRLFAGGSEGELGSVLVNPQGGNVRRASWREIVGQ